MGRLEEKGSGVIELSEEDWRNARAAQDIKASPAKI
jgi:hypothetical protein